MTDESPLRLAPLRMKDVPACETMLRALPDWFGIEKSIGRYVADLHQLESLGAWLGDELTGFLTLRQHFPEAAEIHLMALRREWHRRGIGRALVNRASQLLREGGVRLLQVKTLSPTHSSPHYADTRAFYRACGFLPLEELPTLWGENNPCLIMVKVL
jgi:GNAT superfamily N-acetyltransferase